MSSPLQKQRTHLSHTECLAIVTEWVKTQHRFPPFYSIEQRPCDHPHARKYEFILRQRTLDNPRKLHLICRAYVDSDGTVEVAIDNRNRIRRMLEDGEIDESEIFISTHSPLEDALDLFWASLEELEKPSWLVRFEEVRDTAPIHALAILEYEDKEYHVPILVFASQSEKSTFFRSLSSSATQRYASVIANPIFTDRQIRERLMDRLQQGLTHRTFVCGTTPAPS